MQMAAVQVLYQNCYLQVFPKQLLLSLLPPEVDILCTHPMFGPDSGRGSWQGLNFMYEKVRILEELDPRRCVIIVYKSLPDAINPFCC
jgi:hypothetical protein